MQLAALLRGGHFLVLGGIVNMAYRSNRTFNMAEQLHSAHHLLNGDVEHMNDAFV